MSSWYIIAYKSPLRGIHTVHNQWVMDFLMKYLYKIIGHGYRMDTKLLC